MQSLEIALPFGLAQMGKPTTSVEIDQPGLMGRIDENIVNIEVCMPHTLRMHDGDGPSRLLPCKRIVTDGDCSRTRNACNQYRGTVAQGMLQEKNSSFF